MRAPIDPVLRSAGYYLTAIGRRLDAPLSEASRQALKETTGSDDLSPTKPDLWLRHNSEDAVPLVELKAHGFSPDSTNAKQALKILASAANLATALGRSDPTPGHIIYATTNNDTTSMAATLVTLATALVDAGTAAPRTGVVGLEERDDGIALSSPHASELPPAMGRALASPAVVLRREGDDDLQPLYFIPWLPGIEDSQDSELHRDGLKELTARLLTQAISVVGQSQTPKVVPLRPFDLLIAATFGVFAKWRDSDRDLLIRKAQKVLQLALKPTGVIEIVRGDIEVDLRDGDTQEAVILRLEQADPNDPYRSAVSRCWMSSSAWRAMSTCELSMGGIQSRRTLAG
ncbi:MAG: hypothetical protein ACRDUY_09870 [Nitriliruptorales bacterium]